jgi:hypothetical protein
MHYPRSDARDASSDATGLERRSTAAAWRADPHRAKPSRTIERERNHMTPATGLPTTVTIGGHLTVGRIGYGAMQLTGPKVWGEYPDLDKASASSAKWLRPEYLHRHR